VAASIQAVFPVSRVGGGASAAEAGEANEINNNTSANIFSIGLFSKKGGVQADGRVERHMFCALATLIFAMQHLAVRKYFNKVRPSIFFADR
jgi:hypothetical protein